MTETAESAGSAGPGAGEPAWVLLRAGSLPAVVAGALVTAFAVTDGTRAVFGALVGTALTVVAFCVGPLLMRFVRDADPMVALVLALMSYMLVILVLALAYRLLSDASWLSPRYVGGAIFGCAAAWLAGQVRATMRLRVLTFGDDVTLDSGGGDRRPNTR